MKMRQLAKIEIREASNSVDFDLAKSLFIAYQQFLGVDLCFQQFETELTMLADMYGPPQGSLLIAFADGEPAGCVALRPKERGTCEMKRLFVFEKFQGNGIGKMLAIEILEKSRQLGYQKMVLDTLERLRPALHLYKSLGFIRCQPYYQNPLEGVVFIEMSL